jgi:tyrosinase
MKTNLLLLTLLSAVSKSVVGYAITGVSGGVNSDTGQRPARLDMRDLQSAGPAFDLYVQALSQFQSDDQSDLVSYYEVAGTFLIFVKHRGI